MEKHNEGLLAYKFKAQSDGKAADVYIYGFIGYETDIIVKDIAAFGGEALNVHINSGGGSVIDANAIYNAIKSFKGATTAIVEGMAGSAASYMMLACDTVKAFENATVFIHNPLVEWACGNKKDLEKIADDLSKFEEMYVAAYAAKTGKDAAEIRIAMDEETLFSAAEAKEFGLVDEVISDATEESASAKRAYKLVASYFTSKPFAARKSQERNMQEAKGKIKMEIKDKDGLVAALEALKEMEGDALKTEIDAIISALSGLEIKEKEKPQETPAQDGEQAMTKEQVEAKIAEAVQKAVGDIEAKAEAKINSVLLGHGFGEKGKDGGKPHSEVYHAMKAGPEKTAYFREHKAAIMAGK